MDMQRPITLLNCNGHTLAGELHQLGHRFAILDQNPGAIVQDAPNRAGEGHVGIREDRRNGQAFAQRGGTHAPGNASMRDIHDGECSGAERRREMQIEHLGQDMPPYVPAALGATPAVTAMGRAFVGRMKVIAIATRRRESG